MNPIMYARIVKRLLFTSLLSLIFFPESSAQHILFKDIRVLSNIDSLKTIAKQQKGFEKLKTLLSIEKSYTYWVIEEQRSLQELETLIKQEFPREIHHLNFFKAQYAGLITKDRALALNLVTKALDEYTSRNDTTGQIYSLVLMGNLSFRRDLQAGHYPPFFNDAYKLSRQSPYLEDKLFGNVAKITTYCDSSVVRHKEIVDIALSSIQLIKQNPYFEYLSPLFLNSLYLAYNDIKQYEKCYYYITQIDEIHEKHKVKLPLVLIGNMGLNALKLKKYEEAKQYFERALKYIYANNSQDFEGRTFIFNHYHGALVGLKEYEKASIYADSIYVYARKFRIAQNERTVNELSAKYQLKEKEQEALLLQKEKDVIKSRNNLYLAVGLLALVGFLIAIYFSVRLRNKNQQLETANNNILQLNKLKEYFFSIIAHDLRQPLVSLNGVSGTIQYYLKEKNYDAVERLIYALDESGQKLHNMLNNLLQWASVQRDEVPYEPRKLNVLNCIEETLELYKHYLMSKDIKIEVECAEEASLYADRNGFLLILRNLLGNALKSVNQRKGVIKITATEGKNGSMHITLSDNGSGIDAPKLGLIKEILTMPEKRQPGQKGIGLGLWLVSRFVKRNNGKIVVESKPEVGTTFTLAF